MTANPLVSGPVSGPEDPFAGIDLLSDGAGLVNAVQGGSWVEAAVNGVSLAADVASAVINPLGTLFAGALGWVLNHLQPLKGWLEELTGSASEVQGASQTWANIQGQLQSSAQDLADSVNGKLADQTSVSVDTYKQVMYSAAEHIDMAGQLAGAISAGLTIASTIVQFVHDLVVEALKMIAEAIGAAITPWAIGDVVKNAARKGAELLPKTESLVRSFRKLTELVDKIKGIFAKIKNALANLARRVVNMPPGVAAALQRARNQIDNAAKSADDLLNRLRNKIGLGPNNAATRPGVCGAGGEPVDLASGQWFVEQVDLALEGVLPLLLKRVHASGYRIGRSFGPSWATLLDERLEVNDDGTLDYVRGDASLLVYDPPFDGAVTLPHYGPDMWALRRVDGGFAITDPITGIQRTFVAHDADRAFLRDLVDRRGNWMRIARDGLGQPQSLTHSAGYRVRFGWEDRRIGAIWLDDPASGDPQLIRQFGYTDGHLTSDWNSSKKLMSFEYDEYGAVTVWTDRVGLRYENRYDALGRVTSQGTPSDRSQSFVFEYSDPAPDGSHVTTVIDAYGNRHEYHYDERDRPVREVDALGNVTLKTFDERDRLLTLTDALGHTTSFEYDADGRTTAVLRADGTRAALEFDEAGNPIVYTAPDGARSRQVFDAAGRVLESTDPLGNTTRYEYGADGTLTGVVDPLGHRTAVVCDAGGLMVETTDASGATTKLVRDAFGRVTEMVDALGGVTRFAFTSEGLLWKRVGPNGHAEFWAHNAEGSVVSYRDAAGRTTHYEYGPFEVMTARVEPDGSRYEFGYDLNSQLTSVTLGSLVWTYERDPEGRIVAETDFDGHRTEYVLDPLGQPLLRTTEAGTVAHAYDAMSRLVRRSVGDDVISERHYDAAGRLVRATSPDTALVRTYDQTGRLLTESIDDATVSWEYDAAGQVVGRTTPAARLDNRFSPTGGLVGIDLDGHDLAIQRDPLGRERVRTMAGLSVSSDWTPGGDLMRREVRPDAAAERWQVSYRFNPAREPVEIHDTAVGATRIGLDSAGRVTTLRGAHDEQYRYDGQGKLADARWGRDAESEGARAYAGTQVTRAGRDQFTYDRAGRLVRRRRSLLSGGVKEWTFTWDVDDQLTHVTTPTGDTWRYRYDPTGRRIAKERLDGQGGIAERVRFVWDEATLVEQTVGVPGEPQTTTTWAYDGLIALAQMVTRADPTEGHSPNRWTDARVDAEFYSIVTDVVGAPVRMYDEAGDLAWRSDRSLYGWTPASDGLVPLRFPGQYDDAETGLHYNLFRFYDPDTGRYLSPDPLGIDPGPDPRGYPTNPLASIDPLGLHRVSQQDAFEWMIANHGDMPRPRPKGMQSHHGVMSAWMRKNVPGYKADEWPAVLMNNNPAHNATRGVYNTWRAQMKTAMGGKFDWTKVSAADIDALARDMFRAAKTPPDVVESYFNAFYEQLGKVTLG